MGKGGGCFPSKNKIVKTTNKYANSATKPTSATDTTVLSPTKNLKVFIVFYSMYGHVESLAKRMKKGVDTVDGVEGVLYRVPETLSEDVLVQMQAPPKDDTILELPSPLELADADGFLFGFPTRYGCMAAQMKAFFDSTGLLWKEQKLAGKPAGFFVSTGSQGGGQETTAWTAITQLAHHGMLFVPIGYKFGADMFDMDSIRGGSPYGAGVFAGDGSRKATETELALAEYQGKYMGAVVKKLVHG
ncbi:PREDICTED: probable NAD(P)H dehydrogenase (quinone) FQR1-like 2 [Nicotiana attenuata]|uniref:NAD(P)H dehydrogenase (quinone) n=1 Tax=Nicotiana attenuata TaxID=49451 RepID=A0A1J6JXP8_NICAT|nr:PREDICTED: probable NAD(P)H dehydrogenase (quinone) FQR1-like 2 [Nicotiana attenuata]OIT22541.1 putative nad(p)h dehydrogenase (quinone) fqr1-like 2 [Nicotiana attenuata]